MGTPVRPNGMTSSAAALRYWERKQEVASNNLANVSTDGFKGEKVFARMMDGALPEADAVTDFTPGTVTSTGNKYDVAVQGNGFFVVQSPNGERLSRGGSLHVDDKGDLVDASGHPLLGDHGPIQVSDQSGVAPGDLSISSTGVVTVGTSEVGRLRLETIPANTSLAHEGEGMFVPPQKRTPVPDGTPIVRQGALEESNVTPVTQMVDMISIQRAFTAVQKAMTTLDAARGIATTELGRPAN